MTPGNDFVFENIRMAHQFILTFSCWWRRNTDRNIPPKVHFSVQVSPGGTWEASIGFCFDMRDISHLVKRRSSIMAFSAQARLGSAVGRHNPSESQHALSRILLAAPTVRIRVSAGNPSLRTSFEIQLGTHIAGKEWFPQESLGNSFRLHQYDTVRYHYNPVATLTNRDGRTEW